MNVFCSQSQRSSVCFVFFFCFFFCLESFSESINFLVSHHDNSYTSTIELEEFHNKNRIKKCKIFPFLTVHCIDVNEHQAFSLTKEGHQFVIVLTVLKFYFLGVS